MKNFLFTLAMLLVGSNAKASILVSTCYSDFIRVTTFATNQLLGEFAVTDFVIRRTSVSNTLSQTVTLEASKASSDCLAKIKKDYCALYRGARLEIDYGTETFREANYGKSLVFLKGTLKTYIGTCQ